MSEIEEKYLKEKGLCCPFCKSLEITTNPLDTENMEAWACRFCSQCRAEWNDNYKLVGIEVTARPK
ncbi:MAG TPA: hypothetical protein EYO59_02875 [Chromatiaceae bacterium]|nr:hypothetical protein [Chromatiaceae bacterium]